MELLPQSILDHLAANGRENQTRIEAGEDTIDFEPVVKLLTQSRDPGRLDVESVPVSFC